MRAHGADMMLQQAAYRDMDSVVCDGAIYQPKLHPVPAYDRVTICVWPQSCGATRCPRQHCLKQQTVDLNDSNVTINSAVCSHNQDLPCFCYTNPSRSTFHLCFPGLHTTHASSIRATVICLRALQAKVDQIHLHIAACLVDTLLSCRNNPAGMTALLLVRALEAASMSGEEVCSERNT